MKEKKKEMQQVAKEIFGHTKPSTPEELELMHKAYELASKKYLKTAIG